MKALLSYEENESTNLTEDYIVMTREVVLQKKDEDGNIISEESSYKLKVLSNEENKN